MPNIKDVSIINWNKTEAKPVASGLERTICSQALCGSKNLNVYQRTVSEGRQLDVQAGADYHLVYVIEAPKAGVISFNGKSHATDEGAGVLLRARRIGASSSVRIEARAASHGDAEASRRRRSRDCPAGRDISSIARRSARSPTLAAAACVASASSPPSGFSMAAGSRQPTPFRRARCAITTADRHLIISTSAPQPIRMVPRIATSRSRAAAWSRSGMIPKSSSPARSCFSRRACRIGFALLAVRSTTSSCRPGKLQTNVLCEEKLGLKWYYDP